ncbi:RNA-splicing factor [Nothophoma quercina]|uniref:RNA-splicing factor n=1 Tax=Nothophoma quercina TaxID=749835 RepID=A0ABR3RJC7_9PLEO
MGGDLNLKKSWHPHLRKNQERVWKEEKSALEERKQIEKLRKEREEERALEELQKLQESAGGRTVTRRVDWMYSGPGGDGAGVTEEREGYLLGKRRIDQLLKSNDTKDLQKGAAVGIDALSGTNANTARDTQKKVLEDPLLMIQKQKMEMQLKAMKDAQKQAKYEEKRSKEKDRERRHRDREHRHRDREHREHRHHRRDRSRSPYRREREHHRRHRSRTPPRRHSDSREERLARMQADATSTEQSRAERVSAQAQKDAEEEARVQSNLNTSRRLNTGLGSVVGLGDAIARGRTKEVDV